MASHSAHLADGTDCRWLMLAAEMAGLARGSRQPSPDPRPAGRCELPRLATLTPGTHAGSVRAARDFTLATLRQWDAAERGDDVAVVVAELLTNALRHALSGPGGTQPWRPVRLGLLQPGLWMLCAVADPSKAAPVPRAPGSLAETGRGLHIIYALSDTWGYTLLGDSGKVVWAAFGPQLPPAPSAWHPGRLGDCARRPTRACQAPAS